MSVANPDKQGTHRHSSVRPRHLESSIAVMLGFISHINEIVCSLRQASQSCKSTARL